MRYRSRLGSTSEGNGVPEGWGRRLVIDEASFEFTAAG